MANMKLQYTLLFIVTCTLAADELLLVHVAWRHGDRTPLRACKNDANKESDWPGGWGQLTAKGMEQHVELGKILYKEYVDDKGFLSPKYNPNEVYIRSTDKNRTLLSAVSNLIGMYYQKGGIKPGVDYPNITGWPEAYVPVPIHTIKFRNDHVGDPNCYCPRKDWIISKVKLTKDFKAVEEEYKEALANITAKCGQDIDLMEDLYAIYDAFHIEKLYEREILIDKNLFDKMGEMDRITGDMKEGLNITDTSQMNFLNEFGKVRAGSILWEILRRIDQRLLCEEKNQSCSWIKDIKYYAYSVHDSTIDALLVALGARLKVIRDDFPGYAAAFIIELWKTDSGPGLKIRYRRSGSNSIEDISEFVQECEAYNNSFCSYSIFRERSKKYYPGDIDKLCLDLSSTATNFDPDVKNSSQRPNFTSFFALWISLYVIYVEHQGRMKEFY